MSDIDEDHYEKTMEESNHGNLLLGKIMELQLADEMCDCTLNVDGAQIKVHKVMLVATSDFFRAMFLSPMQERCQDVVELKGLSPTGVRDIVTFIYTGKLAIDLENLNRIVHTASFLQVNSALNLCSEYINSLLTFDTADDLLPLAKDYSLNDVIDKFNQGVEKWLNYDTSRCRNNMIEIYKHIRFSLMSEVELDQVSAATYTICSTLDIPIEQIRPEIDKGQRYHSDRIMSHPIITSNMSPRTTKESLALLHQGNTYTNSTIEIISPPDLEIKPAVSDTILSMICRELRATVLDNFIFITALVDHGGGSLIGKLFRYDPRHNDIEELEWKYRSRMSKSFVGHGGILYLLGGLNQATSMPLDICETYNLRTQQSFEMSPLPHPVHLHAALVFKDKIYITGGVTQPGHVINTAYVYDIKISKWTEIAPLNCARRLHCMLQSGGQIMVLGGISHGGVHDQRLMPIEVYDPHLNIWTEMEPHCSTLPANSVGHFSFVNDKLYCIGRQCPKSEECDFWQLDPDKGWTLVGHLYHSCSNGKKNIYRSSVAAYLLPIKLDMNVLNHKND
ncbi:unnamed protein product [Owenia fusiformis]|uniref:Uncharacterized protein n=1 Tax=Owenia fusiformis TaxID=6347 RepID=A0A8J1YDN1_OWEFU|nr:unnamed protein product [Owenia fusiformis]